MPRSFNDHVQDVITTINQKHLELIVFTPRTLSGKNGVFNGIVTVDTNGISLGIKCMPQGFVLSLTNEWGKVTIHKFPKLDNLRTPDDLPENFGPDSEELSILNEIFSTIYPGQRISDPGAIAFFLEAVDEALNRYKSQGCLPSVGNEYSSGRYGDSVHTRWLQE